MDRIPVKADNRKQKTKMMKTAKQWVDENSQIAAFDCLVIPGENLVEAIQKDAVLYVLSYLAAIPFPETTAAGERLGPASRVCNKITKELIGKRILFHDGDNDSDQQTCVARVSPNGTWCYLWPANGIYDTPIGWRRCEAVEVVEILGFAVGGEAEIKSGRVTAMRDEYHTVSQSTPR